VEKPPSPYLLAGEGLPRRNRWGKWKKEAFWKEGRKRNGVFKTRRAHFALFLRLKSFCSQFFRGILGGLSLVFGQGRHRREEDHLLLGFVILLSSALFCPWSPFDAVLGAMSAQSIALAVAKDAEAALNGRYAANGAMTSLAANYFFVLSPMSKLKSLLAVFVGVFVQSAIEPFMVRKKYVVMTSFPFLFSSMFSPNIRSS